MKELIIFSVVLFGLATISSGYRILVYNPKCAHSHTFFMGSIADHLARAGHEVTTLMPVISHWVPNGTSLSKIVTVATEPEALRMKLENLDRDIDWFAYDETDLWSTLRSPFWLDLGRMYAAQCKRTLREKKLLERLKEEKFDVYITENMDYCGIGLSHLIRAKATIVVASSILFDDMARDSGVPTLPSIVPCSTSCPGVDPSSFWSRAKSVAATAASLYFFSLAAMENQAAFREKYGPDFPALEDLTARASFVFANSEPFIDYAKPTLRKIVEIGGIGVEDPKLLTEEWERILRLRKKTVLVSFGSIVKSSRMPNKIKQSFIKVLAKFEDVTFLWKYEDEADSIAKGAPNVVLRKWIPQNDLLAHKSVVGFISHGGMASCQEAAARGVPGLYAPIFGDQLRNAGMMAHAGLGIEFNKFDLHREDLLEAAVRRLLYDQDLAASAARVARMLKMRPHQPVDELVKHVEFAAEFGTISSLHPLGRELNAIRYYSIDVFLVAGLAAFALLAIALILSLWLTRNIVYYAYRGAVHVHGYWTMGREKKE